MNPQVKDFYWAVVKVERGIPVSVALCESEEAAETTERRLRVDMNPDNDETGIFGVQPGAAPE